MQLNATVIDSSIYHDIFSTTAMRAVWSDQARIQRLPEYVATTFDQHTRHILTTEILQHRRKRLPAIDDCSLAVAIGKQLRFSREFSRAREHDAPWLARSARASHGQARIIHSNCLSADEYRIDGGPELVRVPPSCGTRDPGRFAGRSRQSAVQTHTALCNDERLARHDPFIECFIERGAFVAQHAGGDVDSGCAQFRDSTSIVLRVNVDRSNHDAFYAGTNDLACARWGSSNRGARFERQIHCRSYGVGATDLAKAFHFRMRPTGLAMMSASNDFVFDYENGADDRIRAGFS